MACQQRPETPTPRRKRRLFSPPHTRLHRIPTSDGSVGSLHASPEGMSPEAVMLYRTSTRSPSPVPTTVTSPIRMNSADELDIFQDHPSSAQSPAPRTSPPLERHLNPTSFGMQRDLSISRASINSGSTSKRTMAPTTFESRGFYLGANQRRRQVLTQGVRCTPSELAGLRWRSSG